MSTNIVDSHVHIFTRKTCTKSWIDSMAAHGIAVSGKSYDYIIDKWEREWFDDSGNNLILDMEDAGVSKSVLIPLDFGATTDSEDSVSLQERHEAFHKIVRNFPDKLCMLAGIHPYRMDALRFLERAVNRWEIRGVKLWTPSGFWPNDHMCDPIYKFCEKNDLPVVIHTGIEANPYLASTRPVLIDEVARSWQDVKLILAHAGNSGGWWDEAAAMAHFPNVYLDLAAWQSTFLFSVQTFYSKLYFLIKKAGSNKVLFGSDWPVFRAQKRINHKKWVEMIKSLNENVLEEGIVFTETEVTNIMGKNASKMFRV